MILKERGNLDLTMTEVQRPRAAYEWLGSRSCLADGLYNQGKIERLLGRLDAADRTYRASLPHYLAIGSADATYAGINLALTLLDRGDCEGAEPTLRRLLTVAERQGRRLLAACGYLFLLPCLAARGDAAAREEWQASLNIVITAVAATGMQELDLARGFEAAGPSGIELGFLDQAAQAYRCAVVQWDALEQAEAATRCREALAALG